MKYLKAFLKNRPAFLDSENIGYILDVQILKSESGREESRIDESVAMYF